MATFKTPGVKIQEVQTLPPSVAPVPTSIPGFVGFTEKTELPDGTSLLDKPTRITSLLEFEEIFGGAYDESFTIELTGNPTDGTSIEVKSFPTEAKYLLYYNIQMFYANGGGVCYVTSVGSYTSPVIKSSILDGLNALEQIDDITILAIPDAIKLSDVDIEEVYDTMLGQCEKLEDRFSILDVLERGTSISDDAEEFRSSNVGAANLKYGASYYPQLKTSLNYEYDWMKTITIDDLRSGGDFPLYNTAPNNTLYTVFNGVSSFEDFTVTNAANYTGDFRLEAPSAVNITLTVGTDFSSGSSNDEFIQNLTEAVNAHPELSQYFLIIQLSASSFRVWSRQSGIIGNSYEYDTDISEITPSTGTLSGGIDNSEDKELYNRILASLSNFRVSLYPSGTMAGVFARVDGDRGVWKAPANVGLRNVTAPAISITDQSQQNLNVDPTSGKSINAIRTFTGRGTLVWGARTLDGNSNEWRYVNVRRLFLFAEESIKKASEFVVFESNTANTWERVRGLASNFLTSIWRDGALAGATPEEAYFVRVGLGETMTSQDILEGRLIVEIGLAAVRPAEFIVLRFSHKLQE